MISVLAKEVPKITIRTRQSERLEDNDHSCLFYVANPESVDFKPGCFRDVFLKKC